MLNRGLLHVPQATFLPLMLTALPSGRLFEVPHVQSLSI